MVCMHVGVRMPQHNTLQLLVLSCLACAYRACVQVEFCEYASMVFILACALSFFHRVIDVRFEPESQHMKKKKELCM